MELYAFAQESREWTISKHHQVFFEFDAAQRLFFMAVRSHKPEDQVKQTVTLDEAATALQGFIAKYPDEDDFTPNAMHMLGCLWVMQRRPKDAQEQFETVILKFPNTTIALHAQLDIGRLFFDGGDYAKARVAYKAAFLMEPDIEALKAKFGERRAKARQLGYQELQKRYAHPFALYMIAQTYLKQEDLARAIQTFERLALEYPEHYFARLAQWWLGQ
jgi:TolA-binding protein